MKKPLSYNLSVTVHKTIEEKAKADNRSKSDWLNLHLIDLFGNDNVTDLIPKEMIITKTEIEKPKAKSNKFISPKQSDIKLFEVNENLNLTGFFDYYESNGWKVGKNTMKDWKAAARGWSKRQSTYNRGNSNKQDFSDDSTDWVNKDWGLI